MGENDGVEKRGGILSSLNITEAITNKDILILNQEEENLSPIGYDLSLTKFVYSKKYNMLYNVKENNSEGFVDVEPRDTVLVLTQEVIWVSDKYAGTIHSTVSMVSNGFSSISTTVDPNYEGPLLITFTNLTNKKNKLIIYKKDGTKNKAQPFATLVLHSLISPVGYIKPKQPGREDILIGIKNSLLEKKGKKYIKVKNALESINCLLDTSCEISKYIDEYNIYKEKPNTNPSKTIDDFKNDRIDTFKTKYNSYRSELVKATQDIEKISSDEFRNIGWIRGAAKYGFYIAMAILIGMDIYFYVMEKIQFEAFIGNLIAIIVGSAGLFTSNKMSS